MTREEFLQKISKIVESYEDANDEVVDCVLSFGPEIFTGPSLEWNGERFIEVEHADM